MPHQSLCRVQVPGKINLSLDVTGQREDGYHLLETIMQSVELYDHVSVTIDPETDGIHITSDQSDLVTDEQNTCHKAALLFRTETELAGGIHIHIEKNIPEAAGMGGGSADAAGVLYALQYLCGKPLSADRLVQVAEAVGADVPFCLTGGTAFCSGIGEQIRPLPAFSGIPVLLVKPVFGVKTRWVFRHLDHERLDVRPVHAKLIRAIETADLHTLASYTANVLETVTVSAYPILSETKRRLSEKGAVLSLMSGSGPTVFGLFDDVKTCRDAAAYLQEDLGQGTRIVVTQTCSDGPSRTSEASQ